MDKYYVIDELSTKDYEVLYNFDIRKNAIRNKLTNEMVIDFAKEKKKLLLNGIDLLKRGIYSWEEKIKLSENGLYYIKKYDSRNGYIKMRYITIFDTNTGQFICKNYEGDDVLIKHNGKYYLFDEDEYIFNAANCFDNPLDEVTECYRYWGWDNKIFIVKKNNLYGMYFNGKKIVDVLYDNITFNETYKYDSIRNKEVFILTKDNKKAYLLASDISDDYVSDFNFYDDVLYHKYDISRVTNQTLDLLVLKDNEKVHLKRIETKDNLVTEELLFSINASDLEYVTCKNREKTDNFIWYFKYKVNNLYGILKYDSVNNELTYLTDPLYDTVENHYGNIIVTKDNLCYVLNENNLEFFTNSFEHYIKNGNTIILGNNNLYNMYSNNTLELIDSVDKMKNEVFGITNNFQYELIGNKYLQINASNLADNVINSECSLEELYNKLMFFINDFSIIEYAEEKYLKIRKNDKIALLFINNTHSSFVMDYDNYEYLTTKYWDNYFIVENNGFHGLIINNELVIAPLYEKLEFKELYSEEGFDGFLVILKKNGICSLKEIKSYGKVIDKKITD